MVGEVVPTLGPVGSRRRRGRPRVLDAGPFAAGEGEGELRRTDGARGPEEQLGARAQAAEPVPRPAGPRRRPRIGTAGRLAAFHALVIATVLGIVALQYTRAFAGRYLSTVTNDLSESVAAFSQAAADRPAGQSMAAVARDFLAGHAGSGGDLVIVTVPSQRVALGTADSRALAAAPGVAAALKRPPARTETLQLTVAGTREEVLVAPIVERGRTIGTFVTAGSLAGYEQASNWALRLAIGEGLVTLVAATASVYLLLRRLLGSVQRLTRTARDIVRRGDLGLRVSDERGGDEVGEMAATFDTMIDRIDQAMSAHRQLLSDVSHQLRSPLTVMRGHLEVMTRGPLDDPVEVRATTAMVMEVLDRMRAMVDRVMMLGRSLEVDFADLVPVDLRSLVVDVATEAEVLAPRDWQVGAVPDVVLHADLEKVRGALLNLVDNAVKATAPGDAIRFSAQISSAPPPAPHHPARPEHQRWVDLVVDDSGPGIPPAERAAALARFSRSPASYEHGTGLGLAIVAAVAHAHGGTLMLDDAPLGGLRAALRLPLPALRDPPECPSERRSERPSMIAGSRT